MDSLGSPQLGGDRFHKLSHTIADRLRAQIILGRLKPGDCLPPEPDLQQHFNVSRPTLREAMRVLEGEALISVARGSRTGATVLAPTVERAAEYAAMVLISSGATVGEMQEARAVLEPAIVEQLVKRRDPALLYALQAQLELTHRALNGEDNARMIECVNGLHAALVHASGNRALILVVDMLKILSTRTADSLAQEDGGEFTGRSKLAGVAAAYERLLPLMRAGQAEEARLFWSRYMETVSAKVAQAGLDAEKLVHPRLARRPSAASE